ncbi:LamG domain-containing protein, partial [archaeon]|nr:LamG domain-containing protein [archaeon]
MKSSKLLFALTFIGLFLGLSLVSSSIINLALNDSSDLIAGWMNRTSVGSLGAGLDGPVLFMDFNKDADGTSIRDNSINNNYGTNNGATYNSSCGVTDAGNDLGGCYDFDGTNDYIEIADTADLSFGDGSLDSPFSVAMWMKKDQSDSYARVFKGDHSDTGRLEWSVTDSSIRLYDDTGSNAIHSTADSLLTDTANWYHVIATYDGSESENGLTLYRNGVEIPSTNAETGTYVAMHSTDKILSIGGSLVEDPTYKAFTNGSIDNVQIFNRVLTASEIANLYNGTVNNTNYYGKYANEGNFSSAVFYNSSSTYWNVTQSIADSNGGYGVNISDPNLVSYWPLDESFDDLVGGNDGTQGGGVTNATGISSGAMNFDGVDDYISLADI